jgi:hypothetical protein
LIVKKDAQPFDLPGQQFFPFLEEPAPQALVRSNAESHAAPARAPTKRNTRAEEPQAAANPLSIPPVPDTAPLAREFGGEQSPALAGTAELRGAFLTEARSAELFLATAAKFRPGQVRSCRIVFKPFRSTLYSFKIARNGVASVKFHQSFRGASETVLEQAMQLMLARRKAERKLLQRDAYDAFVRTLSKNEFALPGARKVRRVATTGPGKHRSLEDSFARVNAAYFEGRLARPELCWSPVRARRVLGSYQERYDRLIISRVFDSLQVPEFVLDYLMFHELLHKFLGIGRRDDGKRCMHGPEFRSLEKQFKQYAQALAFLKKL